MTPARKGASSYAGPYGANSPGLDVKPRWRIGRRD
jgi:hypothetical protein